MREHIYSYVCFAPLESIINGVYVVSYYVANQQHLLPLNGQKYDRTHFIKPISRKRVYKIYFKKSIVVCT